MEGNIIKTKEGRMFYIGQDSSSTLQHWKYIKKVRSNGKWIYYYPDDFGAKKTDSRSRTSDVKPTATDARERKTMAEQSAKEAEERAAAIAELDEAENRGLTVSRRTTKAQREAEAKLASKDKVFDKDGNPKEESLKNDPYASRVRRNSDGTYITENGNVHKTYDMAVTDLETKDKADAAAYEKMSDIDKAKKFIVDLFTPKKEFKKKVQTVNGKRYVTWYYE